MNNNNNSNLQDNNTPGSRIAINAQYVKDLSFESPNAPQSLVGIKTAPKIDLKLDLAATPLSETTFEIALTIKAAADTEEQNLFLVELCYAGVFTLENVPAEQQEFLLLAYCPSLLFPFARRVIADATRDGGFQPLMIDPIDFAVLYAQRKQEATEQKELAD